MERYYDAPVSIAIVGNAGATNVGESLRRAALAAGHSVTFFDAYEAHYGPRLLKTMSWRFADRRPLRLKQFAAKVVRSCTEIKPQVLISTGAAPLAASTLQALRRLGVVCVNYSTDDPWSRTQCARWHLRALPFYNLVFTPRRANMDDFRRLGCANLRYLPFAYDPFLFDAQLLPMKHEAGHDVLFVGGADVERVEFITEFMRCGPSVTLVGSYWEDFESTRYCTLGRKSAEALRALTAAAKINLCLVRRSNRDGHVMRSFEIGAVGGCMLAEDTQDHREIFGADSEAVVYFKSPREAARRSRVLLADPAERIRLSSALRARIAEGPNTYQDRLASMLEVALRTSASQ